MTTDLIVIDDDKVALIKRTVAKDATDDELELFLHQARKMGLDPLARQIHFQKFKSKKGPPKVSFITTIDGYRLIADRTGKYAGNGEPVFEGEINSSEYGAGKGPNIPAKATVTVYKVVAGYVREFSNSAYWQEYYPGEWRGHMWRKMPHVMLAKVAEAGALRKAFPADLSGVYTSDEMDQAHIEIVDVTPEPTEPETVLIDSKVEYTVEPDDNGNESEPAPEPLPDDEQAIYEMPAAEWVVGVIALIDRYDNAPHVKNTLKQLGYTGVPKGNGEQALKRLEMYRALKEQAVKRDLEDPNPEPIFEDSNE